jgi:transcriptional regulator with XRE-family HTH domain
VTPQEAQAIREALNLTPIKLAAYMGVDDRSVKRWEALGNIPAILLASPARSRLRWNGLTTRRRRMSGLNGI